MITPFESPTGLAFYRDANSGKDILYVAYTFQEPCIRDNPNSEQVHELSYRPRTFVHPLYFHYDPAKKYALSNGYLIELSYVEELEPLYNIELKDVEWRIALPLETHATDSLPVPTQSQIIRSNGLRISKAGQGRRNQGQDGGQVSQLAGPT